MAISNDDLSGAAVAVGEQSFVFGQSYLDRYPDRDFDLGDVLSDHTASGGVEVVLGELAPGASVTRARVRARGEAFRGLLSNFRGARVTPSPLVFDAEGAAAPGVSGQRAFVVDFGGVRTVLGLAVPGSKAKIVLVLPWMGTDFAPKAIYPVGGAYAMYAMPVPDTAGKASVGFPAIETAKLFVQIAGSGIGDESQFAENARIVTGVLPTNLRASVNGRPVFFTHPGTLDREVELAGLATELNAIAGAAKAPVAVTLSLATDTPGALLTSFDTAADLDIERSQAAQWGGRESLDLSLAGLMPTPVELVYASAGAMPWQVSRIALELAGSFPPWRAFGPVGTPPGRLALKVNAQFSVARRFAQPGRTVLHGLALLLRLPAGKVELRMEIAADAEGVPAEGAPLATVDLAIETSDDAPGWHEALVATPFDTGDAAALWVVVKGKSGVAEWISESESATAPPPTLYTNEGGRWQRYPVRGGQSPAPLLRVLREPLARENAPLCTLALATGAGPAIEVAADPSEEAPVTVEFALPVGQFLSASPVDGTVAIGVTATTAATGTLTVRRATAYFRT